MSFLRESNNGQALDSCPIKYALAVRIYREYSSCRKKVHNFWETWKNTNQLWLLNQTAEESRLTGESFGHIYRQELAENALFSAEQWIKWQIRLKMERFLRQYILEGLVILAHLWKNWKNF